MMSFEISPVLTKRRNDDSSASARIETPCILLNILLFLPPVELASLPEVSKSFHLIYSENIDIIYQNALKTSFLPLLSFYWPTQAPHASSKSFFLDLLMSLTLGWPRGDMLTWNVEFIRTTSSVGVIQSFLERWYKRTPLNNSVLGARGTFFCPLCDKEETKRRGSPSISIATGNPSVALLGLIREQSDKFIYQWEPSHGTHQFELSCNLGCGFHGTLFFDLKPSQQCRDEACLISCCRFCGYFSCDCNYTICRICNVTSICFDCIKFCKRCNTIICDDCLCICERCDVILCGWCSDFCGTCNQNLCKDIHGVRWLDRPINGENSQCEICFQLTCDICNMEICNCSGCSKHCDQCHKEICTDCATACEACPTVMCNDCKKIA